MLTCNFTQKAEAIADSIAENKVQEFFKQDDGVLETSNMLLVMLFRACAHKSDKDVEYQYEGVIFPHDKNQRLEEFWKMPFTDVYGTALEVLLSRSLAKKKICLPT